MGYWEKRQQQLITAMEKDEAQLNRRLTETYEIEADRLEKHIAAYYMKYGKDEVIEYRDLLKALTPEEYSLLMRDMDEFAEVYSQYEHLIPARKSAYIINRLEGLQISVRMQQLKIGALEQQKVENHLNRIAERSYDAVLEKTGPVGEINPNIVKSVVNTNWTGKGTFSQSIWGNTQKLSNMMNTSISSAIARGDNYDSIVRKLRKEFMVGKKEAYRLIYTEGTFVMNEASAQAIEKMFDYYSVEPIRDGKACERCLSIASDTASKPVRYSDRVAGLNFPPFHPWCRCSTIIVIPDKQEWIERYVMTHGGDPQISNEQKEKARQLIKDFVA